MEQTQKLYHNVIEIKDWINSEEFNETKELPDKIKTRLKAAGVWRKYLEQSLKEYIKSKNNSVDEEELEKEKELAWKEMSTKKLGISKDQLGEKIRTNKIMKNLSMQKWENNIETMFLERKSEFDKASCKILRMVNKNLLNELYFRIKNGEISFEQASVQYGQLPENTSGGRLGYKSLREIEFGLGPLLEKMKPGQLCQPLKIGNGYCIVMLDKFKGAKLDNEIVEILLTEKFNSWIRKGVDTAVDILQ